MGAWEFVDRATIGLSLLAIFVAYYAIGSYLNYRKLSQFKGPPLASITRAWLFWQEVHGRTHKAQHAAIKKYGISASGVGLRFARVILLTHG